MKSQIVSLEKSVNQKLQEEAGLECDLWMKFKGGDKIAMDTLFRKYHGPLKKYGLKIHTDTDFIHDCIQEMFLDFWLYRDTISEVKYVKFYIIKCFKRKVIKNLEAQAKRKTNALTNSHDIFSTECFESEFITHQDQFQLENKIANTLKSLSKRQQQVINLKYYQNLSYEEICTEMALNYQSVKNLIHNSIKILKHKLLLKDMFIMLISTWPLYEPYL